VQDLAKQALDAVGLAVSLPRRLAGVLDRAEAETLAVSTPRLERQLALLNNSAKRAGAALVFAALLIAGAIVRSNDLVLGNLLMIGSVIPLLYGLWRGSRRR
jgi:hypothetical protein